MGDMEFQLPEVAQTRDFDEGSLAWHWRELQAATAEMPAPLVALSLDAMAANAASMRERAGQKPIRIATKSLRVRDVLRLLDAEPWTQGLLAFSLDEALWLSDEFADVVVAYPQTDIASYRRLGTDDRAASRVTVMIDSVEQLDLIDAAIAPSKRADIRVAIELDASWRGPFGHIGVRRSSVHSPQSARDLAELIVRRPGFQLVGLMAYEAQVAGVADNPANRLLARTLQAIQRRSVEDIATRRAEAVRLINEIAPLEFVNGGGTGSLESTAEEDSVTDIAAGSGFFGPHLFDHYSKFKPAPAVAFALDVVRKPSHDTVTCFGGGWVASGPASDDRLPQPVYPTGLRFLPREAAGEVQTPLQGPAAGALRVGDRVWFRHTKSGEVCEHVNALHVVSGGELVGEMPTYRGEGRAFV